MKICDITQFYSPLSGGVKRYLNNKISFIREHNMGEHITLVPGPENSVSEDGGLKHYFIKSPPLPFSGSYRILLNKKRIDQIIMDEKPDLIEIGDAYQLARMAVSLAKKHKIPAVAFYHSDYPRALGNTVHRFAGGWAAKPLEALLKVYTANLFNKMDSTLVASRQNMDILKACGVRSLDHVPIGIDTDVFSPRADAAVLRKENGVPEGACLLLYAGRISPDKNIKALVSMMSEFIALDKNNYYLWVVGGGRSLKWMKKKTAKMDNVRLIEYCNNSDELACYYSAADLFIHPGMKETFGLTLLEAQSSGTPAVSVSRGLPEENNFGGEEFIAASGSGRDIAQTVLKVTPLLKDIKAADLHAKAVEQYNYEVTFKNQFEVYRKYAG